MAVADILVTFLIGILEVHMFHYEYTGVGHFFAPQKFAQGSAGAPQCHFRVTDAVLAKDIQYVLFRAVTVDAFYGTSVHILADGFPISFLQTMCKVNFADHGRQNMAAFQVEVIIRTVQIGRHDSDIIRAVLQVETFAHFQTGNFGDGVWLIRIFQW